MSELQTFPTFKVDTEGRTVQSGYREVSAVYPRAGFKKTLTASPIVSGNRKDPNPHSFSLKRETAPWGEFSRVVGSRSPIPNTYSVKVSGYFGVAPSYDNCSYPFSMAYLTTENDLLSTWTNARQKCLQKLWEEVRKSEVNLGTTVGEGRESLGMLRNIASHAVRIKKQLILQAMHNEKLKHYGIQKRKKKFPSGSQIRAAASEMPTTVAGLWLGWSVGLAPLISDCENIRNHSWTSHPLEFNVKSRASHTIDSHKQSRAGYKTLYETCQTEERVQMGAKFRIVDPAAWEVWRTGVTLRPTLAWELTTLSFVCDYFVQIGGYLACIEAALASNGFEFINGYESTSRRIIQKLTATYSDVAPINYTTRSEMAWGFGFMEREITSFDRKLLTSAPLPKRPVVKLPTASTALLNCAALLQLLFLSKR